ncbi:hypothetical protein [Streptomyces sp. NRRL F-5727]|uniref:hypothetical protein n=1 Tax=Streptomyces sp. NRRL F-5727 TaxID=1463871 RepID=UPI00131D9819|nr:hypothetical protein [Streptomyces sp. NRRL F-5727]
MERGPVRTGQSVLAVAAVVSLLPALAIGLPSGLGGIFLLTATPVSLPLFLRRSPQAFAWASLIIGTGLLAWAVVGLIVGLFLFIPAALMLQASAFVDARTRPGVPGGVAALGVPLASGLMFYGIPGL